MQLARKGFLEDGLFEFGEVGELLLVGGFKRFHLTGEIIENSDDALLFGERGDRD